MNAEGERKALYLGRTTKRKAEQVETYVDRLVAAQVMKEPVDHETAKWVSQLGDALAEKLASHGLIAARLSTTLDDFITPYCDGRTDLNRGLGLSLMPQRTTSGSTSAQIVICGVSLLEMEATGASIYWVRSSPRIRFASTFRSRSSFSTPRFGRSLLMPTPLLI